MRGFIVALMLVIAVVSLALRYGLHERLTLLVSALILFAGMVFDYWRSLES